MDPKQVSAKISSEKQQLIIIELKHKIAVDLAQHWDGSTSTICTILKQELIKAMTPANGNNV